jgi:hypothetical protein
LNLHQNIVHRILTEELGLCKANFKGFCIPWQTLRNRSALEFQ